MEVPHTFMEQLETALHEVSAFSIDRNSGGYVSDEILKSHFEADYMIAYRFRNKLSDLIYSTDADLSALCGPTCLSIRSFTDDKKKKRKKATNDDEDLVKLFEISGGSNTIMNQIKNKLDSTMPDHKVNFVPAKYSLLEERNSLTLALFIVGLGCDVFLEG